MRKIYRLSYLLVIGSLFFQSCIKDDFINDFVEPELRILNKIDTLGINSSFTFDAKFLNNIGQEQNADINWQSSDNEIIEINDQGNATGLSEGLATITANLTFENEDLSDSFQVVVAGNETTIAQESIVGTIETTTFYTLEGDFEFTETESGVKLSLADNYEASSSLPGLYVYLSNNRNSIANAHEISKVTTFKGSHEYTIEGVGLNDYSYIVYFCKPFNVKVGDATL